MRTKLFFICAMVILTPLNSIAQERPKAIQLYENAWAKENAKDRLTILKSFWTEESIYEDPSVNLKGTNALKAVIDKFWQDFPQATFEIGAVLSQGNFHTWNWIIYDQNKNILLAGVDVAQTNDNGQIIHLIGFWQPQK